MKVIGSKFSHCHWHAGNFLYWFTKVQVLNIISLSALIYFSFLQTPALIFLLIYSQVLVFIDFHNRAVLWRQLADFHDNDNRRKKSCQPCKYEVYFLTSNNENYSLHLQVKSLKHNLNMKFSPGETPPPKIFVVKKLLFDPLLHECLIRVFNQRHSCKTIQNNPFKLLWCKSCQRKEERLQGSDMPHTVSAYLKIRKQLCITLTLLGLEDRFQE